MNRFEGNPWLDYRFELRNNRAWVVSQQRETRKTLEPPPDWLVEKRRRHRRNRIGQALQRVGVGVYLLFAMGVTSTASCWTCVDGVISPLLLVVLGVATALVAIGMWLNGELD